MSTKVPPDGGWGWVIVVAYALSSLSTIPVVQGFGLVFKDSFAALQLTATDATIIINVNLAFGMVLGLFNGPLLKTFGYRKMALVGSLIFATGVTLTAFANSFAHIIVSYGILASIGMGMTLSSFSLAINSYFTTKRGRAIGLAMTMTGLGSIFIPQVASFLLSFYGIQGTVLIFGAYSLHAAVGATLLQPHKWHMKNAPTCLETVVKNSESLSSNKKDTSNHNVEDEINMQSSKLTTNNYQRKRKTTISSIDHDVDVGSIYGFDTSLPRQISVEIRTNQPYDTNHNAGISTIDGVSITNLNENNKFSKHSWWNSAKSVGSINLGSSIQIFNEPAPISKKLTFMNDNNVSKSYENTVERNPLLEKKIDNDTNKEDHNNSDCKSESGILRILRRVAVIYDLDLLRDPIYVNIMLGMSIAIFAEVNFSLLTPFILADMNMTTAHIASVMSVIAAVDLVSRGAAPFMGEWLRQPPRIMYLLSLCLLIISRTSLIFTNSFSSVLIVAVGLGAAKGIRSVYMALVVPSYVPIQKLPNASGIQMLTNGMILTCAGPMLGVIRDNTGSYIPCIILINCVTAITITIWSIEMILIKKRSMSRKSGLPEKC